MSSVNFLEAMETLRSMFPEVDTVTVRDVLDKHGGFMEGAVEELLGISRAKRGMGGGQFGGDESGGGGSGRGGGGGGYSDEPPRSNQMGGRGAGSDGYHGSRPPHPEEEGSIWGWLTGADDDVSNRAVGGSFASGYGRGAGATTASGDDDAFTWIANSASFYAGELSRNVKSMTDALAEELLGPAEDEEGDVLEEEDESVRGNGTVVAGGATVKVGKRKKKKDAESPKPKQPPRPKRPDDDTEEEDDVIGGVLNLLGLEDDEEDEPYVRRDTKKDK